MDGSFLWLRSSDLQQTLWRVARALCSAGRHRSADCNVPRSRDRQRSARVSDLLRETPVRLHPACRRPACPAFDPPAPRPPQARKSLCPSQTTHPEGRYGNALKEQAKVTKRQDDTQAKTKDFEPIPVGKGKGEGEKEGGKGKRLQGECQADGGGANGEFLEFLPDAPATARNACCGASTLSIWYWQAAEPS
jgi:hypothetical protein